MIDPHLRLRRAIHAADVLLVKRILTSHPHLLHNPDTTPAGLSNTNLHLAATLGQLALVKLLSGLGHDTPLPQLNERNQTALMLASQAGHTDVVYFLADAQPEAVLRRDRRGRDAIMEAALGGHDTVLQILLTYAPGGAQAAVRAADNDGNTALHFASSNGNLLVLRTLLAAGAEAGRRNAWNWTAVEYSATVQAEVYLKGLVAEVEKRRGLVRKDSDERSWLRMGIGGIAGAGMASVRMVEDDDEADESD